jgi:RNA polymerase subunit RPABC4/transcription elongation factor Spt4
MTARVCHNCGSALGVDDDLCQACGARNPVVHPWYI